MPARFDVAEGDVRACGVLVRIDRDSGRARSIERFQVPVPRDGSVLDAS